MSMFSGPDEYDDRDDSATEDAQMPTEDDEWDSHREEQEAAEEADEEE